MSWELRLEQLAFDTEVFDLLLDGKDCLVMMARYLNEEYAEPIHQKARHLNRIRQGTFEQAIHIGLEDVTSFVPLALDDIRDEEKWRDEDIDDGYWYGASWRRPTFYGDYGWEGVD